MITPSALVASPMLKLLGSGLQRVADGLFRKILRLRKIDSALNGDILKNDLIRKAVEDFEIVLGTYRGEYDTRVDQFLRSLERSGLIETIAQSALLRRPIATNKSVFLSEWRIYAPEHSKSGSELYEQLYLSFEITLREIAKDPVISDLIVSSNEQINARLDTIESMIVVEQPDIMSNHSARKEVLLKIARGLQQSYKDVRIETIRSGAKLVSLDKIYIPPRLSNKDLDRDRLREMAKAHPELEHALDDEMGINLLYVSRRRSFTHQLQELRYPEFRSTFRRAVILGDPGGGKSTLCQKLCYDLTKNYTAAIQTDGSLDGVPSQSQKLAIRIVLRKFEQARLNDPQLDFLTYIAKDLVSVSSSRFEDIDKILRDLLQKGHAVLAFDGLDEILDTSNRREFVQLVELFADQYPLCPVMVTSRIVGYEDAALSSEFERLHLSQLETDQVESYVKKFLQVVAGKTAKEAGVEAKRFISQTNENASDLRRNPLLLGLMAFLFHAKGDVPENRPEIYSDCATLMFDRWDKNRGISPDVPSDFERAELFSDLASRMFPNVELRAGVSRDWLLRNVLDFFQCLYLDKSKAVSSARSITAFLVGRAWVMSEVGDQVFAFTHQTFLEFYFARKIEGDFDSVGELLKFLHPRIVRSEWDVVSHLSLQLKVQGNLRKQDEALKILAQRVCQYKTEKYELAYRLFAARSLEYLNGSEESVSSLIENLCNIESQESNFSEKIGHLSKAIRFSNHRNDLVINSIVEFFERLIISSNKDFSVRIYRLFMPSSNEAIRAPNTLIPATVSKKVRARVRDYVLSRASTEPTEASIALQWYGVSDRDSLSRFGLEPFQHVFVSDVPTHGLSWLVLGASDSYYNFFLPKDVNREQLRNFLSLIADMSIDDLRPIQERRERPLDIPAEVWTKALDELSGDISWQVGAAVVFVRSEKLKFSAGKFETDGVFHHSNKGSVAKLRRKLEKIYSFADERQKRLLEGG